MLDNADDLRSEPTRKPRKKMGPQTEEAKVQAKERGQKSARAEMVGAIGVMLPTCPTNPQEIVNAWGVRQDDVESHSVLVFRQKQGEDQRELIDRVPILGYDLDEIAARFGPGTYFIKGSAGIYERKTGRFQISQDFASKRGFGKLPEPPKAADLQAVRTLERVSMGAAVDPVDLTSAIQRAAEAATRQILESYGIRPGMMPGGPAPTFQSMENQFTQVEKMYGFMERMEQRAMESVERRMGIEPKESGADPNSWAGILAALAPFGVKLAEGILAPRPKTTTYQTITNPAEPINPQPQEEPMPDFNLSDELKNRIMPAVAMLAPFKAMLARFDDGTRPEKEIAISLLDFVPPGCYEAMTALADLAAERGPAVLQLIGKDFMTPRWVSILRALATEIRAEP